MKVPSPERPSKVRRLVRSRAPSRRFGNVDDEPLVVVAVPGDVGFQVDAVAGQAEPEEGRFAVGGDEVVDRDFGQRRRRRDHDPGGGEGDGADPHLRERSAGRAFARVGDFFALRRRLGVDGQPDREVDADLAEDPDRGFHPRQRAFGEFDRELGEAHLRVAGGFFVELTRGCDGALGRVRRAGPGLPAVGGRMGVVLGGDDVAGRRQGGRARHPCERQQCKGAGQHRQADSHAPPGPARISTCGPGVHPTILDIHDFDHYFWVEGFL